MTGHFGDEVVAPKVADPRLVPGRKPHLTSMLLVGGLTAALFGSRVLLQEIQTQPDMPYYEIIRQVGLAWQRLMQRIGATAPDRVLHDGTHTAEGARFSGGD